MNTCRLPLLEAQHPHSRSGRRWSSRGSSRRPQPRPHRMKIAPQVEGVQIPPSNSRTTPSWQWWWCLDDVDWWLMIVLFFLFLDFQSASSCKRRGVCAAQRTVSKSEDEGRLIMRLFPKKKSRFLPWSNEKIWQYYLWLPRPYVTPVRLIDEMEGEKRQSTAFFIEKVPTHNILSFIWK